jgi:beta-glucosidase/6-phospho-beta-glucosidase/beta-galactosidase
MRRFVWGAATAAYQVEGAAHEDGRGEIVAPLGLARGGAPPGSPHEPPSQRSHATPRDGAAA